MFARRVTAGLIAPAILAVLPVRDPAAGEQATDVAMLVAAARQALGGEAALSAVATLTISGEISQPQLAKDASSFESSWIVPDRFLRVSRRRVDRGAAGSYQTTDYAGFNGETVIRQHVGSSNAPNPVVVPGRTPSTTDEAEAAQARRLESVRSTFFESMIPLFVNPPGTWGLGVTFAGRSTLGNVEVDAIDIKRPEGRSYRLLLDAKTHLPLQLIWRGGYVLISTSPNAVRATGRPGTVQVLDPAALGLPPDFRPSRPPDAEWILTIQDYRPAGGLNWPRRLTSSFDGQEWEDIRISRYRVNAKIDPGIFERGK